MGAFQFVICLSNVRITFTKKRDDVPRWCVCMSGPFDWITLIVGNMLGVLNILILFGGVDSRNCLNIKKKRSKYSEHPNVPRSRCMSVPFDWITWIFGLSVPDLVKPFLLMQC